MLRDWIQFFDDMLESCEQIQSYSGGMDWTAFARDRKSRDALVLQVLQLGEAARHIPEAIRNRFPDIPWAQLVATRNVLVHAYFAIDDHLLWDMIANKVPELFDKLREMRVEYPELFR